MASVKLKPLLALTQSIAFLFLIACNEASTPPDASNISYIPNSNGDEIPFMTPKVDRNEWWSCDNDRCQQVEKGDFLLIEERGPLAFIDSGSVVDGPAYIINKNTGEKLGHCGGLQMLGEIAKHPCDFDYWLERI